MGLKVGSPIRNTQYAIRNGLQKWAAQYAIRNTQYAMGFKVGSAIRNTQYVIRNTQWGSKWGQTNTQYAIRNTQWASKWATQYAIRNTQYAMGLKVNSVFSGIRNTQNAPKYAVAQYAAYDVYCTDVAKPSCPCQSLGNDFTHMMCAKRCCSLV